jgi:hypothetical protein
VSRENRKVRPERLEAIFDRHFEDVYALGASRDARIIDRTPSQEVLDLVQQVEQAEKARRASYYQVSVEVYTAFSVKYPPWAGATVVVTHCQEKQTRRDRRRIPCPQEVSEAEAAQYLDKLSREPPLGSLQDVEAWLAHRKPNRIFITDNARGKCTVYQLNEEGALTTDTLRVPAGSPAWGLELDGAPKLVEDEGSWGKLIGIENHNSALKLHRWYFNAARDYLCEVMERQVEGSVSRRTEVVEYDKTPAGQ